MHPPRRLRTLGGTNNTTPNAMKRRLFCFVCLLSATASAHQGNSELKMGTQQQVAGTLTDIVWRNPHIILTLATTHDEGRAISLEIEAALPNILRVGRFSKDSLHVGEQVTALVSPSRRFPDEAANGYEINRQSGRQRGAAGHCPPAPPGADDHGHRYLGFLGGHGRIVHHFVRPLRNWPLNEEARAMRARFTPKDSGQAQCVPVAAPMLMVYPVVTAFAEATDHILITSEWLGATRTVYTDSKAHPPGAERSQQGHSVGHWEGETLVVDTTHFSDQETGGFPSGGQRHLVERFALADGGRRLSSAYVLEDPQYLTDNVAG